MVNTINRLQNSPYGREMAILIADGDSDSRYGHVMPLMSGYRPVSYRTSGSYNMRHQRRNLS